jgi:signal peptidase I
MIKAKQNHPKPLLAKRPLKEFGLFVLDILYNAVIIIVLVVLIRTFLISPFRVIGSSMADTLENNEFILIDKLSYQLGEPKRGDPIVFLPPITNKYPPKFEEAVTTDATGKGVLGLQDLITPKDAFYCRNGLIQKLWFCQQKVRADDTVYLLSMADGQGDADWRISQKKTVTPEDLKSGELTFQDGPNQSTLVRVYQSTGPEYFVKRIIGIPGDTVRIENGRVYLKKSGTDTFAELNETYLNPENLHSTFLKSKDGIDEFMIPAGHFFVLGDNRTHSNDSRHWFSPIDETATPFLSLNNISGRVMVVLWPLRTLGFIDGGVLQ